jgi:lysozyme family protein
MTATFNHAMDVLATIEGGWSNDPDDKGGLTRYGLSRGSYPDLDFDTLTPERAREIFYEDFWLPLRGDALDPTLAKILFIFAVNSSTPRHPVTASKILQRVLNDFLTDLSLDVDGRIGSKTVQAAARVVCRYPEALRMRLAGEIYNYYQALGQRKFLNGWLMRLWRSLS